MISRRSLVLGVLVFLPVLVYGVLASYSLWATGLLRQVWWLGPACWVLAWGVAKLWKAAHATPEQHAVVIPSHWTPRDRQAAEIVRAFQQKVDEFTPAQLTEPQFYQTQVQAMAVALAGHYHPGASDPLTSLTVPEVLAAVRLAVDDTEQWLLTSVPGSRLLSIRQWQMLQSAPTWIRRFQNATWAASMLMNPLNIARFWSSRMTADPVTTELQQELLAVIYLRFMRQMGFYLIEMNSGRLRAGADAYRRAFPAEAARVQAPTAGESPLSTAAVQPVTVSLVGQVSSGKSSLINALTGVHQAAVDILPETRNVARYEVPVGQPPVAVTLLDTPGYGEAGASADQLTQIRTALQESNAVLVVMDAHSPAREADRRTIRELEAWYRSQPRLKPPPMLGVLTHIDLLRPVLEWSPPYNWREPTGTKEQSIDEAVRYVNQLFASSFIGLVPVCSDAARQRTWGILEELIPALTAILSDAQSAALLRAFERELDRGQLKTLLKQLGRMGSSLFQAWVEERLRPTQTDKKAD
ncbi:MAG TPA: GTPase [Planctomycetaceae bacterium]|nr:GTPase [Planctomycetaceae bacterium]